MEKIEEASYVLLNLGLSSFSTIKRCRSGYRDVLGIEWLLFRRRGRVRWRKKRLGWELIMGENKNNEEEETGRRKFLCNLEQDREMGNRFALKERERKDWSFRWEIINYFFNKKNMEKGLTFELMGVIFWIWVLMEWYRCHSLIMTRHSLEGLPPIQIAEKLSPYYMHASWVT